MIIYPLPPQELDDKTLSKQIKAIAQTLCNVHHYFNNKNVPLVDKNFNSQLQINYGKWVRTCLANYKNLVDMGMACCEEYSYRFSYFDETVIANILGQRTAKGWTKKTHKLQPVIEWARDNVPELDNNLTKQQVATKEWLEIGGHATTTAFPLEIPAKYWDIDDPFPAYDLEQSYRNYYRAKLQRKIKCKECIGGLVKCDVVTCKCCDPFVGCETCKAEGYINNNPTWTRRKKPTYIEE